MRPRKVNILCLLLGLVQVASLGAGEKQDDTITQRFSSLRTGKGVPEAASYDPTAQSIQPVLLLKEDGTKHSWADLLPPEWRPKSVHDVVLIGIVGDQKRTLLTQQKYRGLGGDAVLKRYQYTRLVEVFEAKTGKKLAATNLRGIEPRHAGMVERGTGGFEYELLGTEIPMTLVENWLRSFVHRPSGHELLSFSTGHSTPMSATFSRDGKEVIVALDLLDRIELRRWSLRDGKELGSMRIHSTSTLFTKVCFSPVDNLFATLHRPLGLGQPAKGPKTLGTVRDASGAALREFAFPFLTPLCVTIPHEKLVVFAGESANRTKPNVEVCDLKTGQVVHSFVGPATVSGMSMSVSQDSRFLLAVGGPKAILYDLQKGTQSEPLPAFAGWEARTALFSPVTANLAATAGSDNLLQLWDVENGKELHRLKGHEPSQLNAHEAPVLAFSPDGKRLVSGGRDHTVRVWDVITGRQLRCFVGHTNPVTVLGVSPDNRFCVSANWRDRIVCVWSLPGNGKP